MSIKTYQDWPLRVYVSIFPRMSILSPAPVIVYLRVFWYQELGYEYANSSGLTTQDLHFDCGKNLYFMPWYCNGIFGGLKVWGTQLWPRLIIDVKSPKTSTLFLNWNYIFWGSYVSGSRNHKTAVLTLKSQWSRNLEFIIHLNHLNSYMFRTLISIVFFAQNQVSGTSVPSYWS